MATELNRTILNESFLRNLCVNLIIEKDFN